MVCAEEVIGVVGGRGTLSQLRGPPEMGYDSRPARWVRTRSKGHDARGGARFLGFCCGFQGAEKRPFRGTSGLFSAKQTSQHGRGHRG